MEAGEYGLTLGTCFVARRLKVVAVAGLLCISRCVLGGARFFRIFFSSNAHGLLQVCAGLALLTSLLILRQRRESEATEAVICFLAKKPLHTGVRTGCHYLICLSVSVSVCNIRRFY